MPRANHLQGNRSGWGGVRPGAGRKHKEEGWKRVKLSITLDPELLKAVHAYFDEKAQEKHPAAFDATPLSQRLEVLIRAGLEHLGRPPEWKKR
jgi:hypothetical protein